jgi:hypothetical protein
MGAKCRNCQANVGCGCNLKDGLCSYCQAEMKKHLTITPPQQEYSFKTTSEKYNDDKSKTDQLSRVLGYSILT